MQVVKCPHCSAELFHEQFARAVGGLEIGQIR